MMTIQQVHYEALLAEYSDHRVATQLLKGYRPYLEMVPSMRRPNESLVCLPLPLAKLRTVEASGQLSSSAAAQVVQLPCDLALLMCDPEWKIKMGAEICIYLYRPQEDFSDLLGRWRKTQVLLSQPYEWVMPHRYKHIFSEGEGSIYPLFVVFEETPQRIFRGLQGAQLPFVVGRPSLDLAPELLLQDDVMAEIPPTFSDVMDETLNN
jgi:hypothetical protein